MLKDHWNTFKICLFDETTKQQFSNFKDDWVLILVAYKKVYFISVDKFILQKEL